MSVFVCAVIAWHTRSNQPSNQPSSRPLSSLILFAVQVVSFAQTLERQGRLCTPLLRQLFGVEPMHQEGKWFDPAYANAHFRPDLR
jgi:hypothetical protein